MNFFNFITAILYRYCFIVVVLSCYVIINDNLEAAELCTYYEAMELIKSKEDLKLNRYYDLNGKTLIGYGDKYCHVGKNQITKKQALECFDRTIKKLRLSLADEFDNFNCNQVGALMDFVYTTGEPRFRKSNFYRKLKAYNDMLAKYEKMWFLNEQEKKDKAILESEIKENWMQFRLANGNVVKHIEQRRVEEIEMFFKKVKK